MEQKYNEAEQPKTLKHYYKIIINNLLWVILITIVVFGLSFVKLFFSKPVFTANAVVMVEDENQMQSVFNLGSTMNDATMLNEIEILNSRYIAEKMVVELWNSPYKDNLYLFGTREYSSQATVVKQNIKDLIKKILFMDEKEDNKGYGTSIKLQDIVTKIKTEKLIGVSNRRETNILDINFQSIDSLEAILLTNTFVETYQNADAEWSSKEVIELHNFLTEQLNAKKKELVAAENALKKYQEGAKVFTAGREVEPLIQQITTVETQFYNTDAEIKIAENTKSFLAKQLNTKEKELAKQLSSSIDSRLFALRTELSEKEAELIRTNKSGNQQHQAVNNIRRDIKNIQTELTNETNRLITEGISVADPLQYSQNLVERMLEIDAQLSGLYAQSKELKKIINRFNKQLDGLPAKQLEYVRFERNRQVLSESYLFLRQKMEEAQIQKASEGGKIRIIDKAVYAELISPNAKQDLLLGLIMGLGLGFAFALFRDFIDDTINDLEDLEFRGIAIVGAIPYIYKGALKRYSRKMKKGKKRSENKLQDTIITHYDPKSPISEAYRAIRTNITLSSTNENVKAIMISSLDAGAGKSTTIANLAITIGHLGKKTVLVDCDLRKPMCHNIFGLKSKPGLVQYLLDDDVDIDTIIRKTNNDNISLITAGGIPEYPSEILDSEKMRDLIKKLKEEFDFILFDTPPFAAVTDPLILAKHVDKHFLVIKAGETRRRPFLRLISDLEGLNLSCSGVIVNQTTKHNTYYSYYSYMNYYQYYGKDKK